MEPAGTGDAANLLKPALARGTLRTIAATTWAEYKKYIEKDPALTRRFQVVQVAEPTEDKAILMVRGVASVLEKHHRVQVLDEALEAAVRLSHRYIPARQLPDKAVSLLDTTCARVAISQHAVPAQLDDCRRTIESLKTELEIIGREDAVGMNVTERKQDATAKLTAASSGAASSRSGGRASASSSIASWRFAPSSGRATRRSKARAASSNARRRRRRRQAPAWRSPTRRRRTRLRRGKPAGRCAGRGSRSAAGRAVGSPVDS